MGMASSRTVRRSQFIQARMPKMQRPISRLGRSWLRTAVSRPSTFWVSKAYFDSRRPVFWPSR
jgi:hypothetical protein